MFKFGTIVENEDKSRNSKDLIAVLEMIPEIAEAGPPQICSFRFQLDFFIPSFFLWEHLRKSYILEDFPSN